MVVTMAKKDDEYGLIIPISWYLDHVQRFTHCTGCNAPDVLYLPEHYLAQNVECDACKRTGKIVFL